jgi:hypothetical protein
VIGHAVRLSHLVENIGAAASRLDHRTNRRLALTIVPAVGPATDITWLCPTCRGHEGTARRRYGS